MNDVFVPLKWVKRMTWYELEDTNERLLEAAPRLLNALRNLLRYAERVNEALETTHVPVDDGPLELAREAIALAIGEQPETTE